MDPLPDVIHRRDESLQGLVLPCRLLGEALAQDDQFLSLEETSVAGGGSADYDFSLPQFALDAAGGEAGSLLFPHVSERKIPLSASRSQ